jgi:predicted nucleotidyltransferase
MRAARLAPRINRAKAEKLLADFLRAVDEVNAHPDLLHWVTEVRVFGSYLTKSDDLGDIDIAIKKERRPVSGSFSDACVAVAEQSSKTFVTDHNMAFYLERLVARLLKGGSRYISLHGVAEPEESFEFGGKTVYTFAPPKRT